MIVRNTLLAIGAVALVGLTACTSTGGGQGVLTAEHTSVESDWNCRDDGRSGTMTAFVGLGLRFSEPFGQVECTTPDGVIEAPLMIELRDPAPGAVAAASPVAVRSEVIADLVGPDRQTVLCSFQLNDAALGMRSGARGECVFDGVHRGRAEIGRS